jgi:hypothetical protein
MAVLLAIIIIAAAAPQAARAAKSVCVTKPPDWCVFF